MSDDKAKPTGELVEEAKRLAGMHTVYVVDGEKIVSIEDIKVIFKSLALLIKPNNPNFELLSHLLTEKKEYDNKNSQS